ncbi:MAG: tetratricopeptide repeat protein [Bacteroidota bacterium]
MRAPQYLAALLAFALLLLMYFVCPVQAPEMTQAEASRKLQLAATGLESMIRDARDELNPAEVSALIELEDQLEAEPLPPDTTKRNILTQLAGTWFQLGYPGISAVYAQQIAELGNTPREWGMAGTSYTICVQRADEDKVRDFCLERAEQAYLAAMSLDPDDVEYQINLALTYTLDPKQPPMRGILQLRDLMEKFPEDPRPLVTLGRLSLQTNQLEKAAERLDAALALDPDLQSAKCLRAEVYYRLGDTEAAARLGEGCGTQQ